MKILIFVTVFMLPLLSFSQQTVNKEPNKKSKSTAIVVNKQIKPLVIHSERPTYIYSDEYRNANGVPEDFPKQLLGNNMVI